MALTSKRRIFLSFRLIPPKKMNSYKETNTTNIIHSTNYVYLTIIGKTTRTLKAATGPNLFKLMAILSTQKESHHML